MYLFIYTEPKLTVKNIQVFDGHKLVLDLPFDTAFKLRLEENKVYEIFLEFDLRNGLAYGLDIVNSIYKGFIRLTK